MNAAVAYSEQPSERERSVSVVVVWLLGDGRQLAGAAAGLLRTEVGLRGGFLQPGLRGEYISLQAAFLCLCLLHIPTTQTRKPDANTPLRSITQLLQLSPLI